MRIAEALREHLPQVAALHCKGALSTRLVSTITWGTRLVQGDEAWAHDRRRDRRARYSIGNVCRRTSCAPPWRRRWPAMTPTPNAAPTPICAGRDFVIGACDDDTETASVWGRLLAPDAAVMKQRDHRDGQRAVRRRSAQRR